jgi:hypothetical protein
MCIYLNGAECKLHINQKSRNISVWFSLILHDLLTKCIEHFAPKLLVGHFAFLLIDIDKRTNSQMVVSLFTINTSDFDSVAESFTYKSAQIRSTYLMWFSRYFTFTVKMHGHLLAAHADSLFAAGGSALSSGQTDRLSVSWRFSLVISGISLALICLWNVPLRKPVPTVGSLVVARYSRSRVLPVYWQTQQAARKAFAGLR